MFDETRPSVNYWNLVPRREAGKSRVRRPADSRQPGLRRYQRCDAGHDLHEIHALIAPRPFLVSGGSEDAPRQWIALNHSLAINKLLGHEGRVAMTNRPDHTPTAESNAVLYAFFEQWLGE
jgi:hypothetical protein